eukprot:1158341-Pelagomonas_calceolata.AAC.11
MMTTRSNDGSAGWNEWRPGKAHNMHSGRDKAMKTHSNDGAALTTKVEVMRSTCSNDGGAEVVHGAVAATCNRCTTCKATMQVPRNTPAEMHIAHSTVDAAMIMLVHCRAPQQGWQCFWHPHRHPH